MRVRDALGQNMGGVFFLILDDKLVRCALAFLTWYARKVFWRLWVGVVCATICIGYLGLMNRLPRNRRWEIMYLA